MELSLENQDIYQEPWLRSKIREILTEYCSQQGVDAETAVKCLFTDTMHIYGDQELPYFDLIEKANSDYQEERRPEAESDVVCEIRTGKEVLFRAKAPLPRLQQILSDGQLEMPATSEVILAGRNFAMEPVFARLDLVEVSAGRDLASQAGFFVPVEDDERSMFLELEAWGEKTFMPCLESPMVQLGRAVYWIKDGVMSATSVGESGEVEWNHERITEVDASCDEYRKIDAVLQGLCPEKRAKGVSL